MSTKQEFFYAPGIVTQWLEDYRKPLGIDLKSVQPYVSLWLNDKPLPDGAELWFDRVEAAALAVPWSFVALPERVEDLSPKRFWYELLLPPLSRDTWARLNVPGAVSESMRAVCQKLLDDYRVRLRKVCDEQHGDWVLASAYRMSQSPRWLVYRKGKAGNWFLSDVPPDAFEDIEHRVTLGQNLQELVCSMEVNEAISTVARARALQHVEITYLDIRGCRLTYDVEVTDDDRAWAESWYRACVADLWPQVPTPFLGDATTQVVTRDLHVRRDDDVRDVRYQESQDITWNGRFYVFGPWEVTAVERDGEWVEPTQEDIDLIRLDIVRDELGYTKDELWPIWRDNQLREGPLFLGDARPLRAMRDGEEQELLATFEKHWAMISQDHAAVRARIEAEAEAKRSALLQLEAEARKLAEQRRFLELLE